MSTHDKFCSIFSSLILLAIATSTAGHAQTPSCPNILLVFDMSGSMNNFTTAADGGSESRFRVGREAIRTLVTSNNQGFRYGLEIFGAPAACDISQANCSAPSDPNCNSVQANQGTEQAIIDVLDSFNSGFGSTPTGPAYVTARQRPDMQVNDREKYTVLITDGDPAGCVMGNALQAAVTGITDLRVDAGVRTFVLGFAGGSADRLNDLAEAGGTARHATCDTTNNLCYYNASNAVELKGALDAIVNEVSGELGNNGCDDSCYAKGCAAGEVCLTQNNGVPACVADACASVTCNSGEVCIEGACRAFCDETCGSGERCGDNGECVPADQSCAGQCNAQSNQVCIGGQCVENYCSGKTFKITCPQGYVCFRNNCQNFNTTSQPDSGTPGNQPGADGGTNTGNNGGGSAASGGCCSSAPAASTFLFGLLSLGALGLRRRRG